MTTVITSNARSGSISLDPSGDPPSETKPATVDLELWFRSLQEQRDNILSMLELARGEEFTRATVWPQIRRELLSHQRIELARAVRTLGEDAELRSLIASHEARAERIDLLVGALDRCDIISEGWGELVDALLISCTSQFSTEQHAIVPKAQQLLGIKASLVSHDSAYDQLSFEGSVDLDDLIADRSRPAKPGVVASVLTWLRAHPRLGISALLGFGIVVTLIRRRRIHE